MGAPYIRANMLPGKTRLSLMVKHNALGHHCALSYHSLYAGRVQRFTLEREEPVWNVRHPDDPKSVSSIKTYVSKYL